MLRVIGRLAKKLAMKKGKGCHERIGSRRSSGVGAGELWRAGRGADQTRQALPGIVPDLAQPVCHGGFGEIPN